MADVTDTEVVKPLTPTPGKAPPIKYGRLRTTHPRLDLGRIRLLHALYRGGNHLLSDGSVMDFAFGKIGDEADIVYEERKRRAFYENLFAMVINQISAGLAQDPCRLAQNKTGQDDGATPIKPEDDEEIDDEVDDEEDTGEPVDPDSEDPVDEEDDDEPTFPPKKPAIVVKPEPQIDEYWIELMKNATVRDEDGGQERTFDQVMRDICVEALTCGWAWFQVDLPKPDDSIPRNTLGEQEEAGDLRAYIATWPTDAITDWEEINGKTLWVRTYEIISHSMTPDQPRWPDPGGSRIHRWTIWNESGWQRYDIIENKDNPLSKYGDETLVQPAEGGTHTFGCIPWVRFDLCTPGTYLHVGDLIESLCRVYFNRTNGEAWQWTQNCFQQLYEFLGPEISGIDTPISDAQTNPARAQRQRRAPGVVHVRGENDKAMYVSPNMQGADIGKAATQDLRDAVLRVTSQMALAQDTSGAMLRRSADSKKQDSVAQEIIMGAVGKRLLIGANRAIKLCAIGRGDDPEEDAPDIEGYARFDVDDATTLINDTVLLDAVAIPSATYQIEQKFRVASAHLGDNVQPEILKKIRAELESSITQDQLDEANVPPPPFGAAPSEEDPEGNPIPPEETPPSPFGGKPKKKGGFPFNKGKKPFPTGKSDSGPKKKPAPGHQEKPWSCGPASLVNVCAALGMDVSEKELREHGDVDKEGTDEDQLIQAAKAVGLTVEVNHTGDADESWSTLTDNLMEGMPSVLCVDQWDHWVAVVGLVGDRVVMLDSANTKDNIAQNGVHLVTKSELLKRWRYRGTEKSLYSVSFRNNGQ